MAYLMPCECGARVAVTAGQAGGTAACGCGRSHPVPSLGELRRLPDDTPPAEAAAADARAAELADANPYLAALAVVGVLAFIALKVFWRANR